MLRLGLGLVLIRILLINLSSRLCLYAGCTLVSKSAGFSIPSTVTLAGTRMVSRVPEPKLGGFNATEQGLGDNISIHSVQHWML